MKPIQVQLTATLDEAAAKNLADFLASTIKLTKDNSASGFDERKDARMRASQNAIFGGGKPPEDQGLLIGYKEVAELLKVSQKTVYTMVTTGKMPPPFRLGRAIRWSLETLKRWVEAGCPVDPEWRTEGSLVLTGDRVAHPRATHLRHGQRRRILATM